MVLYLRNQKGQTIAEVEIYIDSNDIGDLQFIELSSSVDIRNYSNFLLSLQNSAEKERCIFLINDVSNLRSWLWEVYFAGSNNDSNKYDDVVKEVKQYLTIIANRLNLNVVED